MIYQIVSYDTERNIVIVQVAEDQAGFEGARQLPITLHNVQSTEEFEKLVYLTYVHTLQVKERSHSLAIENYVRGNISTPLDFSLPIVPVGTAQSSTSDAQVDDNSDPEAQVI